MIPEKPSECAKVTRDPKTVGIDEKDVEFVIYYTADSHWMKFFVIEPVTWSENGIEFQKSDWSISPDPTTNPDAAEVLVHGTVKGDGCMDCDIGGREISYRHHFCGRSDAGIIGRALAAVYDLAAKEIESFDPELAS